MMFVLSTSTAASSAISGCTGSMTGSRRCKDSSFRAVFNVDDAPALVMADDVGSSSTQSGILPPLDMTAISMGDAPHESSCPVLSTLAMLEADLFCMMQAELLLHTGEPCTTLLDQE
jgi:hypothetical protein